jgi:hypothetical protein
MAMSFIQAPTHPGTAAGVTATYPTLECRPEACEVRAHIGVFFDGTGNNQDWVETSKVNWRKGLVHWWEGRTQNPLTQLQRQCDSNVARLFRSYPDDPLNGFFRMYVPGVGTPFPEIGESEPKGLGAAFGAGGDGRINFGVLHVLNSMYRAIAKDQQRLIAPDTIRALCRNGVATTSHSGDSTLHRADLAALRRVGMHEQGGLLAGPEGGARRKAFFDAQFARLAQKIASAPKPQLKEVFIDVFGFSRGAAEARVFCRWLDAHFQGDSLAGVRTHLRFLGLFDTVAAVGIGASATRFTNGHQDWGAAANLRVPARVRHTEHYVAMHENRSAFPLEDLASEGQLPGSCRQLRYPGMHSDVGGGYTPIDQGRGPGGRDAEKLSQIPLNHMFDAALAARVPLDKELAIRTSEFDCFEIAPSLQRTYDAFLSANGRGVRPLRDCLMDYLSWRIAVRHQYPGLPAARRASQADREDLAGANRTLQEDLATVQAWSTIDQRVAQARGADERERLMAERQRLDGRMARLSATAVEVVLRASRWRAMAPAEQDLFANHCHDAFAGFKPFDEPVALGLDLPGTWETEGYLRYRVRYEGGDTRLTQLDPAPPAEQAA